MAAAIEALEGKREVASNARPPRRGNVRDLKARRRPRMCVTEQKTTMMRGSSEDVQMQTMIESAVARMPAGNQRTVTSGRADAAKLLEMRERSARHQEAELDHVYHSAPRTSMARKVDSRRSSVLVGRRGCFKTVKDPYSALQPPRTPTSCTANGNTRCTGRLRIYTPAFVCLQYTSRL